MRAKRSRLGLVPAHYTPNSSLCSLKFVCPTSPLGHPASLKNLQILNLTHDPRCGTQASGGVSPKPRPRYRSQGFRFTIKGLGSGAHSCRLLHSNIRRVINRVAMLVTKTELRTARQTFRSLGYHYLFASLSELSLGGTTGMGSCTELRAFYSPHEARKSSLPACAV